MKNFSLIYTVRDFLNDAEQTLLSTGAHFGHGTDNAWDEACALASFVLGLPPDVEESVLDRNLTPFEIEKLNSLLKLRIENAFPVPYLSHTAWFAGLPFFVDRRVLIPRSPLAEPIENYFEPWLSHAPTRMLDLCTGSGCIAVALAKVFPEAKVDAIDIDRGAISVARMNIVRHQVEDRVELIQSDLFNALKKRNAALQNEDFQYDVIISNPPYVPHQEYEDLPKEYSHEPRLALEAGEDGLTIVHRILKEAPNYLKKGGLLIVEVGNAADNLINAYPDLPFIWLDFERGGEGVFLLIKGEASWLPIS